MLDKIFNTLIKLCVSVVILYSILQMFGINERSITAIILTIVVWHVVEWAIDNYYK
jgi:hypothetical protein